ncbi:hypothetical protein GCM10009727_53550 [Actinomadura napierensis]|uniref:Uncharacterized protein n=1 Tax=Actinomadura napierensis TaxID=267854 RepID=A0ABN2ZY82_9ACTN
MNETSTRSVAPVGAPVPGSVVRLMEDPLVSSRDCPVFATKEGRRAGECDTAPPG